MTRDDAVPRPERPEPDPWAPGPGEVEVWEHTEKRCAIVGSWFAPVGEAHAALARSKGMRFSVEFGSSGLLTFRGWLEGQPETEALTEEAINGPNQGRHDPTEALKRLIERLAAGSQPAGEVQQ